MDPFTNIELISQVVFAISRWKLANTIRDNAINFFTDIIKSVGKADLTDRLKRLRSDAALIKHIEEATERAAARWAKDYPDRELVQGVAEDTNFVDLPSVREAVQAIARNPFNPVPNEILHDKFAQILPSGFDSRRIENGIGVFLEYLRQEFVGVSALREVLHVCAEIETARSIQQTEALATALPRIEGILARIEGRSNHTEQTLQEYLSWASNQYVSLYPPGTLQPIRQIQVLIEEMYVPLEAEVIQPKDVIARPFPDDESVIPTRPSEEMTERLGNLTEWISSKDTYRPSSPCVLSELLFKYNKLVILGDPGAGKTTHLRYLVRMHAQALRAGQTTVQDLGKVRLPVYLRLANYAEHGKGRSLSDFILQAVRSDANPDSTLATLIKDRLTQGTCLVLLDGIDEIIDLSKRAVITREVDLLIRMYEESGNQFIITSRLEGYRFTPISGEIPHFRIQNLNDQQILCLLERWCNAVERFESPGQLPEDLTEKIHKDATGIFQAISANPSVRRLVSNPLYLNTVALIHRMGARLPQRRIELYRSVVDILIRSWQLARGIPESALVREANANRLLAELAAWIHETRPNGIIPEGEVREKLAHVVGAMGGQEPDHPDVISAVDDFLSRIRQYTGLFVEGPNRSYSFMHSTIQEYFAARWLVARPFEASQRIRKYLHRPHWTEPILLAIGYFGMEFPAGVSELIEQAILGKNLGGPSPYEAILNRDLLIALRCLGDQEVDHALRNRIIESAGQLALGVETTSQYALLQKRLFQTFHHLRGSSAGKDLGERLVAALRDPNAQIRNGAAYALSKTILSQHAVTALLTAMLDDNESVRESATVALRTATFSEEAVVALLAELRDENGWVRANAANALGNATLPPEAVTQLLKAMRDKDSQVRASAAEALSHATLSDDSVDILLTALHDKNSKIRATATDALGNLVPFPEALEALLVALRDKNSQVRASAAGALQDTSLSAEAITALLNALKDKNSRVRLSATEALRKVNLSPEVITALLSTLRDANSKVRKSAAEALRNGTLSAESQRALITVLKDENDHIRATAAIALRHATLDAEAVTALLVALDDENRQVRESANVALSHATLTAEAIAPLISALQAEKEAVRACAVDALRNGTSYPGVIPALLEALYDKNSRVSANAANALSNSNLPLEAVATLEVAVTTETSSKVRAGAALALSNTPPSAEMIAALVVALRDKNSSVRVNAAHALGNATFSETVVKALLGTLGDAHGLVRSSAVNALKGALGRTDVVNSLLSCLQDVDEQVRVSAVDVLSNVANRTDVVNALLATLEDDNENVRINAANALQNACLHTGAVTVLLAALCEKDERLRASAATALSNATISVKAITALLNALHDENERVRASAADALARIVLQPEARLLSDLPEKLAANLTRPEIDQITGFWLRHPRDSLFVALDAVAPGPGTLLA